MVAFLHVKLGVENGESYLYFVSARLCSYYFCFAPLHQSDLLEGEGFVDFTASLHVELGIENGLNRLCFVSALIIFVLHLSINHIC